MYDFLRKGILTQPNATKSCKTAWLNIHFHTNTISTNGPPNQYHCSEVLPRYFYMYFAFRPLF